MMLIHTFDHLKSNNIMRLKCKIYLYNSLIFVAVILHLNVIAEKINANTNLPELPNGERTSYFRG